MQDCVRYHAHRISLLSPVHSLVNPCPFSLGSTLILSSYLSFKPPHQHPLCPHSPLLTCLALIFL